MSEAECPFKVGDKVMFTHRSGKAGRPGYCGLPKIGDAVRITKIVDGPFGKYVHWEGMEVFPGGALHWTEFATVD